MRAFVWQESSCLLRRRDALLFVELCAGLGLAVQTQALLEGLLLQHEGGAQPQVVRLAQILQHAGPDGDGGHALGHGFHEAVQGAGLAVPLGLVTAAAQERTHLAGQSLERRSTFYFSSRSRTRGIDKGVLFQET